MTLEEAIEMYTSNAEYERTHGSLQGCKNFKQFAEWLKELKAYKEQGEDYISRNAAIVQLSHNKIGDDDCDVIIQKDIETIKALAPITPQPKAGYISIDDVMSVFDDFMCGEVDEDETDTFLEMLKNKAESE